MRPRLRYSGSAPQTARSLTVPWTASLPMSPPGKNERADDVAVGRQDHAALDRRQHRPVGQRPQELVVEGREQDLADQPARQPRALAVGQEDAVPGRPGHGAGELGSIGDGSVEPSSWPRTSTGWTAPCRGPAVLPVGRAGPLARDHRGPERVVGRAARAERRALVRGGCSPCSTSPLRHSGGSTARIDVDREPRLGVEVAVGRASAAGRSAAARPGRARDGRRPRRPRR